jgi:Fic family protein
VGAVHAGGHRADRAADDGDGHRDQDALQDYKPESRGVHRFYSQDLINNLFMHPYTRVEFVERDLGVSRLTATKYLDALAQAGFVRKVKVGRSNYYINVVLHEILTRA